MALTVPKLEGLWKSIPAGTYGGHISALGSRYLASNDYYLSTIAPGNTASVITAWQTLLATDIPGTTVQLLSTGQIKITWGDAAAHSYTFADATFRARMGFSADPGAAAVITSPNQAKSLWLPNNRAKGQKGSYKSRGGRGSDMVSQVAQSGDVWTTEFNRYKPERLEFQALARARVWFEDEGDLVTSGFTGANASFETFVNDFLSNSSGGNVFRYYLDSTDNTSYLAPSGGRRDYAFMGWEDPTRLGKNDNLWTLGFNLRLLTTAG